MASTLSHRPVLQVTFYSDRKVITPRAGIPHLHEVSNLRVLDAAIDYVRVCFLRLSSHLDQLQNSGCPKVCNVERQGVTGINSNWNFQAKIAALANP